MRVILGDENYTPLPNDIAAEFWDSDAERQGKILYALSLICSFEHYEFGCQMDAVNNQLDDHERNFIVFMLEEMLDRFKGENHGLL